MIHSSRRASWFQSIASRLVGLAVLLSTGILLTAGLVLSALYKQTSEQAFDGRLHVYLKALVADVASFEESDRSEPGALGESRFDRPLSGWYWQITRIDGTTPQVLKTSKSLFAGRLPQLADLGVPAKIGGLREAYAQGPDEKQLRLVERIIDLGEDGRYLISVAGDAAEISDEVRRFDAALLITFGILASVLSLSSFVQVRLGLKPLRQLQRALSDIRQGDAQYIEGRFPSEVAPLADELNLLVDSNREIIERARTHVGNLAHALKTPLSVMINEANDDASPLAEKVREQTAVMRDQVAYYLDRARAAARAVALGTVTDVDPVMAGLVRTFEKIYRDKPVRFTVEITAGLRFRGEKQDLEEMIGNLVDNAGKWSAGAVDIVAQVAAEPLAHERPALDIVIDDDGPGLAPEAREEVTRRGRRLDETKPGSGLGLSIVTDLAGLYGGRLVLEDSPKGGLRARLRLPLV
jgi:signal transduction histidine kinase